jgi:hypothetical protein
MLIPRILTSEGKSFLSMKYFVVPLEVDNPPIKIPRDKAVILTPTLEIKEHVDRSLMVDTNAQPNKELGSNFKSDSNYFCQDTSEKPFETLFNQRSSDGFSSLEERRHEKDSSVSPFYHPVSLHEATGKVILGENRNALNNDSLHMHESRPADLQDEDRWFDEHQYGIKVNYLKSSVVERTHQDSRDSSYALPKKTVKFAEQDRVIEFDVQPNIEESKNTKPAARGKENQGVWKDHESENYDSTNQGKNKLKLKTPKTKICSLNLKVTDIPAPQDSIESKNTLPGKIEIVFAPSPHLKHAQETRDTHEATNEVPKNKSQERNLPSFEEWKARRSIDNNSKLFRRKGEQAEQLENLRKRERVTESKKNFERQGMTSLQVIYDELKKTRKPEDGYTLRIVGQRKGAENELDKPFQCLKRENLKFTQALVRARPNSRLIENQTVNRSTGMLKSRTRSLAHGDQSSELSRGIERSNSSTRNIAKTAKEGLCWKEIKEELVSNLATSHSTGTRSAKGLTRQPALADQQNSRTNLRRIKEIPATDGIKTKQTLYTELLHLKHKMAESARNLHTRGQTSSELYCLRPNNKLN